MEISITVPVGQFLLVRQIDDTGGVEVFGSEQLFDRGSRA